jgi:NADP-dependent 3-hydroxy acid dehydrogenase YdfG
LLGAVATELADSVTEPDLQERTRALYAMAIPADVIARAIAYVIAESPEVDVNEITSDGAGVLRLLRPPGAPRP